MNTLICFKIVVFPYCEDDQRNKAKCSYFQNAQRIRLRELRESRLKIFNRRKKIESEICIS